MKKKILKIVAIIFSIWLVIFIIDYVQVKDNKDPIFVIRTQYKDGSFVGYGLGYKVNSYTYDPLYPIIDKKIVKQEIGFYHIKFDKWKNPPEGYMYILENYPKLVPSLFQ